MDAELIEKARRFNRAVTQRVGALNDSYLARGRPLGESRVLWEIGVGGCDVRILRARLGLDSGYASRLLRSLESAGLVTVTASPRDARVRTAHLTKKGRAERALLDRRSDALAESMLEPLTEDEKRRLVAAMAEVERLLITPVISIDEIDPADPRARYCLHEYFSELDRRFQAGFDPAVSRRAGADEMRAPAGVFLVARLRDEPVGCGGLKLHDDAPAEIKRMWVAPTARGLGVGRRLLDELEGRAVANGCRTVQLDTNGTLVEAIAMYRGAGYRQVKAFNDEPYADHWFEKKLSSSRARSHQPSHRGPSRTR